MYLEEKTSSAIATIIRSYSYVLIDTSSLMDEEFPEFMENLVRAKTYLKKENKLLILNECFQELLKHSDNDINIVKHIAATRALKIIKHAKHKGLIDVLKGESKEKSFADNSIYLKVSQDRLHSSILIITQDKHLAFDLLKLNNLSSQKGRNVGVYEISSHGQLVYNPGKEDLTRVIKKPINVKEKARKTPVKVKDSKKNKKEDLTEATKKIEDADRILKANVSNPNYPKESKIKDIKDQISLLEAFPKSKLNSLKISLKQNDLKDLIKKVENEESKKEKPAAKPEKFFLAKDERVDLSIIKAINNLGFKLIEDDKFDPVINGSPLFTKEKISSLSATFAKKLSSGNKVDETIGNVNFEIEKLASKNYGVNIKVSLINLNPKVKAPKKSTSPLDSAKKGEAKLKKIINDKNASVEDINKVVRLQIKKVKVLNEVEIKQLSFDLDYLNSLLSK